MVLKYCFRICLLLHRDFDWSQFPAYRSRDINLQCSQNRRSVKLAAKWRNSSGCHWSKIKRAFLRKEYCFVHELFRAELRKKRPSSYCFCYCFSDHSSSVCYKPTFDKHLNLHWVSASKKRSLLSFFETQTKQKQQDIYIYIYIYIYQHIVYSMWVHMDFNTVLFRRPTNVDPLFS